MMSNSQEATQNVGKHILYGSSKQGSRRLHIIDINIRLGGSAEKEATKTTNNH
jgi:hypothetical protein